MVYRPEEIEEEQEGATAMDEPEIEDFEEEQQTSIWQGDIPQKILRESAIDEIRSYQDEEALIDFTARNFDKKIRDENYVKAGYEDRIDSLKDWTRLVFLTKEYSNRLPTDNRYRVFHQEVKNLKDDLKRQKKGKTKEKIAAGYSGGNSRVFNSSVENSLNFPCPGNILSDISRLEVLVGGKRAGNNSPEIINEAADIYRRLFQGGLININLYRELIEELVEGHRNGYYSD